MVCFVEVNVLLSRRVKELAAMLLLLLSFAYTPSASAQTPAAGVQQGASPAQGSSVADSQTQASLLGEIRPNYILRSGDQVNIRAFEMEEIGSLPYQIGPDGYIDIPVLGRVRAADLSVREFEELLKNMLRPYVRQPQVSVFVVRVSSEPIFFRGAFRSPGIYPLQGKHTLLEMLSVAGGLAPTASQRIVVRRRTAYGKIPLPNAVETEDGQYSLVEISLAALSEGVNAVEDLELKPFDVIQAERSELVYVVGSANGAIPMDERESVSVTKALTLAGGINPMSKLKDAVILRPVLDTSRRAPIPINLERIIEGRDPDFPLLANDVLYIPQAKPLLGANARDALQTGMMFSNILFWLTRF
jgi:polysaccharide export outer membrane protein